MKRWAAEQMGNFSCVALVIFLNVFFFVIPNAIYLWFVIFMCLIIYNNFIARKMKELDSQLD